MTSVPVTSRSLRAVRLRARIPRMAATTAVIILSIAGIRSIVAPPRRSVIVKASSQPTLDQGAELFAESFARAYLTWDSTSQTAREAALSMYLSTTLNQDAGVQPVGSETVSWTAIAGEQGEGSQTLVTVAADTSSGLTYLSVPVARDSHGFLFVPSYPALVGPPATDTSASLPTQQQVTTQALQTVVGRAVTNYLAGNQDNLLADLTPSAVVSLPVRRMTVTQVQPATWIVPGQRVAVEVTAADSLGNTMTLTYQVGVQKQERWYVQSIEVDPTFEGGSP